MDALVVLIPLMPLAAAVVIGIGQLFGALDGEPGEKITSDIAVWAVALSCLLALTLLGADYLGKNDGFYQLGSWLNSDTLDIRPDFITSGFNVRMAALFAVLLAITTRFSVNYMHREAGFHRFFFVLSLFSSAMLLLVLSGNAVGTFFGWEIAGLSSYLLIAYAYDRPVAATNATRAFVTNRVGDAGFILGICLSYAWIDNVDWAVINEQFVLLPQTEASIIALCFATAAFAKSAQLPFTPWLSRAMEGPTPSSAIFYGAVMVHAGVYLMILLQPVFEHAPLAMAIVAATGLLTAVYAYLIGLTQTDVKSSLIFATSGQVGLMFMECGFGLWQWAEWHLYAHAAVRGYQFLTAPSMMHNVPDFALPPKRKIHPALFVASLQRFWLEPIIDWLLVKPVQSLAHDLSYFDDHIVDRTLGVPAPAIKAVSSLAQLEEQLIGAHLDGETDRFAQASGFAGKLTEWSAAVMHWFEDRFVLRGIGKEAINYGRVLGHFANRIEQSVLRPRYLVIFVCITLLVAF